MSNEHSAESVPESPRTSDRPADGASTESDGETYRLSGPNPMLGDPSDPPVRTPMHTFVNAAEKAAERKSAKRSKSGDYWAIWGYNALVFVTSICVMTLELTASRLIQKSVGSSLYTWTSVIGVVLAGITLGNFLGGWLADRFPRGRTLAWMYLFGSVACASVLWLDQLVAPLSRPSSISLPTWVLMVVSAMFLLPSLALGTISPLVASMALSRSSRTGATVGNVYAWGALGSIIGTFLTGFYLMDVFGTRTIIGLTAGTLGVLAVIVAGAPRLFRAAVVCGWLQLLGWTFLAATCTEQSMAATADSFGTVVTLVQPNPQAARTRASWANFGSRLGTKLQELGLLLKLRDDRIGAYYDESSYSTIQVTESTVKDGEDRSHPVKHLRLDKLIHSYYDPANPDKLYYEYEQIYAAVTKRTAGRLTQPVTLSIKALPTENLDLAKLPAGISLDAATGMLRIDQPTSEVFDALLALAPSVQIWNAIDQLYAETNKPLWGGFSFSVVDQVPEGFSFPEDDKRMILFDRSLGRITAYEVMTPEVRDQLIDSTPLSEWYREIQRARGMSRRATAFFIGGGGFIFPRWFLKEFPGSPRIEVAELDPAVYRAAIEALGLTAEYQQRILTTIGDARNVIDDRLRDNRRLSADGSAPIRYDFIYGDAFNDFSVPAHLTTREFLQKVNDLLSDEGVFQANLIDIYPRYEYPGATAGNGETTNEDQLAVATQTKKAFAGTIPAGLLTADGPLNGWKPAAGPWEFVETCNLGNNQFALGFRGLISARKERDLMELAPRNKEWQDALQTISAKTRQPGPGRFLGRFVNTAADVFPNVYLFSTSSTLPGNNRDTFVVACSRRPLDLHQLKESGDWNGEWFAAKETTPEHPDPRYEGQMTAVLSLAEGHLLTDDFAPVDNLLRPVFTDQH